MLLFTRDMSAARGGGGGSRAHGARGRLPSEKLQGECSAPSASDKLCQLNGNELSPLLFLQPSLMPLHIVTDSRAAAPLSSILGCYLPESECASSDDFVTKASCYIHIKDPSIRALCSGDEWTVVSNGTVIARWVLDPAHLKQSFSEQQQQQHQLGMFSTQASDDTAPINVLSPSSRLEPLFTSQQQHPDATLGMPQQGTSKAF